MTHEVSDLPRRRQPSADALAGREAAVFVRELNRKVGEWQAHSVKLSTMAERLRATGNTDPAVAADADVLLGVVMAEAQRFEYLISALPPAIAQHGRIKDTRRSFEMVAQRLRTCLDRLGVDSR